MLTISCILAFICTAQGTGLRPASSSALPLTFPANSYISAVTSSTDSSRVATQTLAKALHDTATFTASRETPATPATLVSGSAHHIIVSSSILTHQSRLYLKRKELTRQTTRKHKTAQIHSVLTTVDCTPTTVLPPTQSANIAIRNALFRGPTLVWAWGFKAVRARAEASISSAQSLSESTHTFGPGMTTAVSSPQPTGPSSASAPPQCPSLFEIDTVKGTVVYILDCTLAPMASYQPAITIATATISTTSTAPSASWHAPAESSWPVPRATHTLDSSGVVASAVSGGRMESTARSVVVPRPLTLVTVGWIWIGMAYW